jgi:pimeloyl-ACP methyl ester carboxylesterase
VAQTSFEIKSSGRPSIYCDIDTPEPKGALDRQTFPLFVIAHGFLGHKDWGFLPEVGRAAVDAGHCALRFSFSHCGVTPPGKAVNRPDLFKDNFIKYELEDYAVLFDALGSGVLPSSDRFDLGRIILVGFSRGGSTALLHASRHVYENRSARVKALCTIGAMSEWFAYDSRKSEFWNENDEMELPDPANQNSKLVLGKAALDDYRLHSTSYNLLSAAGKLNIPWLIIHGGEDQTVPVAHAHSLFAHADERLCRLEIVSGADHSLNFFKESGDADAGYDQVTRAIEAILEFTKSVI